jgi:RHS repeat-associated protein
MLQRPSVVFAFFARWLGGGLARGRRLRWFVPVSAVAVVAVVFLATGTASVSAGPPPCSGGPLNSAPPLLSPAGTGGVGTALATTDGSWEVKCFPLSGSPTYQWYRGSTAISGATSNSYTTVSADANHMITAQVTQCDTQSNCTSSTTFGVFEMVAPLGTPSYTPIWSHGPVAVNEATGNMILSLPTPSYPTATESLGFSLTYNSQATAGGSDGLATGWVLSTGDASAPSQVVDDGADGTLTATAEVDGPDGSPEFYQEAGSGNTYVPLQIDGSLLTKNTFGSTTTWTLAEGDGSTYTFNAENSGGISTLNSSEIPAKNATGGDGQLSYSYDTSGRVTSVAYKETPTSSSSETLSFNWSCTGFMFCVTGPDGVQWEYSANGSNEITEVNDGSRNLVALTYTGSQITKIQNADDLDPSHSSPGYNGSHALTLTYDSSTPSRVTCVIDGPISGQAATSQPSCAGGVSVSESTWSFNYSPTCPTLEGPAHSHSPSQGASVGCTTVTNPDQQPSGPGITVLYDSNYRPLEYDDARLGSGNERIKLVQYNAANEIAWSEDELGNPTDYSYDGNTNVLHTVTKPTPTGGTSRPVTSYRYDEQTIGTASTAGNPLTGLAVSYWTNSTTMTGLPVARETDPAPGSGTTGFSFSSGSGWPPSGVSGNTSGFSARWTGELTPSESGPYVFTTTSHDATNGVNDGTHLVVNGIDALDNMSSPSSPASSQTIHLSAGHEYLVTLEYAHVSAGTSGANVSLQWACSSCSPAISQTNVPVSDLDPAWENQTSVVSPAGRISFQHYLDQASGQPDYSLVKLADGTNLITSYVYDSLGRLTKKYMPKANASATIDSTTGNLTSTPDTNYETDYSYYGDGTTAAPPSACGGGTAVNQYGQLEQTSIPNGGLHTVTSVYNSAGLPIATTNGAGTTCSTYNNEGRLNSTQPPGDAQATTYTYDPNGTQLSGTNGGAAYHGQFGSAHTNTGSTTKTITLTAAPGAGNAVFLREANANFTPTATAVTDSEGNSWVRIKQGTTGEANSLYATLQDVAPLKSGDTITITFPGSVFAFAGVVDAFSGITSLTSDQTASASDSVGSTARNTGTTATTTEASELQIAGWGINAAETSFTPSSGASSFSTPYLTGGMATVEGEYKFVNATGAFNLNATGGASGKYNGFIVTLPAIKGGTSTDSYDEAGRLIDTIDSTGAEADYTYDPDGNQLSQHANTTSLVGGCTGASHDYCTSYSYDNADHLTSETDPAGNSYSFIYAIRGNLRGVEYPNGTFSWINTDNTWNTQNVYNRHGTITSTTTTPPADSNPLADYTYTYVDSSGVYQDGKEVSEVRKSGSTSQTTTYTYDNAGRISQVLLPTGTCRNYSYDLDSNRTQTQESSTGCSGTFTTTASYTYDPTTTPGTDQLTKTVAGSTTTNYGYTNDGQTSSQGTTTFSWDGWGNLRTGTVAGNTITYAYDPNGNLIARASSSPSSTLNYPLGDQFETNAAGTITTSYTEGPEGNLASYNGPPTSTSTVTFLYYDGHGNLAAEANSSGTLTANHTYDSFGAPNDSTLSNTTVHRFVGRWNKQYDTTTGDILMGARPYDPTTGRFLSVDPVPGGSLNNYDYAGQDPINAYDLAGTVRCGGHCDGDMSGGVGCYIGGNGYCTTDTAVDALPTRDVVMYMAPLALPGVGEEADAALASGRGSLAKVIAAERANAVKLAIDNGRGLRPAEQAAWIAMHVLAPEARRLARTAGRRVADAFWREAYRILFPR